MPSAARTRQPARPRHRGHGHGQDGDAADAGGGFFPHRRAGLHGRREGRPDGHQPARAHRRQACRHARRARPASARAARLPHHALGRVRRTGPPGARHHLRHGPAAARAHAGPERDATGGAQHRLQDRRRPRPAAARPQGPACHAGPRGRERQGVHHRIRQHQRRQRGRHPARAAADRGPGRRPLLRRAHAQHPGLHADGGRTGRGERPRGRQAHEFAAPLRHLPALDALGAVRAAARDRRPRAAQAGVLLRRGPPALQRGAQGAGGAHRTGGAPRALQGRGRVLRHPEPAGHPRQRAGAARQPRAARAARLHAARPEGREGHRHHHAAAARPGHRGRHHRAGRGRGAGEPARRQGAAGHHRARVRGAAGQPDRPDHRAAAAGADGAVAGGGRL
ncbi:hypothetical protein ACAN107058_07825 [Paracidovorax anthurii]